jgi:hypothetical protein
VLATSLEASKTKKVIRRVIMKKLVDGTMQPIEVTKTVIDKDGTKKTFTSDNTKK